MTAEERLLEEKLYALVLQEIESGIRRDGLWAKALSDCNFDEQMTKALYIKLRVQSIKDEQAASSKPEDPLPETLVGPVTSKSYECKNCNHFGQMLLKRTGLLIQRTRIYCPICGNTGPIS